ncbi:NADH dehydrogenase subunit C [Thermincola ferriacetica]|uniref:NADH-quinone oxidoreductase subunit C n=2 Tax=Thermincola TaxID=278993 RepID=D5X8K5_THEPJ|nr:MULTISPECIES: NADH-quinone oxidoreductase subunit C [Thermincola]ADG82881.1 NADH (or F420H2) dehydrogenase, subunit C [Thermincola potens JR]KNZ69640.1 NADH dehydrogenase subunit C [Thermincola ferriacetica]
MAKVIDRQALVGELNKKFGDCAEIFEDNTNQSIKVKPDKLVEVMLELRDNPDYDFKVLMNLSSVDYPENFTVVYHLNSLTHLHKLTVKVELDKANPQVPSITSVWNAANVQEREVYDLMGIVFTGHPNLKRILLADDFVGHPLRKDFKMQA